MVDVQVGMRLQPRADEVEKALEGALLAGAVDALERREPPLRIGVLHAPQILEAARRLEERIALDVEEDVAGRWRRQQAEAALRLRRQQLVVMTSSARCYLQPRLTHQPLLRLRRDAGRRRGIECGERRDGRDAFRLEALDLVAPHPRHQAQMVIVFALRLAVRRVAAQMAVRHRQRILSSRAATERANRARTAR